MGKGSLLVAVAAALLLAGQSFAAATVPVGSAWTDPAHDTPLEILVSRIASHIAGRPVAVRCESDADWTAVVSAAGGEPGGESGFVATGWSSNGQLVSLAEVAEVSSAICAPLEMFAEARVKPTTCAPLLVAGLRRGTRRLAAAPPPAPVPCYIGGGKTVAPMSGAYWNVYAETSIAILTLAHESIHLGGVVGGTLSNGLEVGDLQAEAKADCFGMQWMPYVAQQLGDDPVDAQAIADYFWDNVYGLSRTSHPAYWSDDCRPGGALDARPPGAALWP